ncbi:MAG: hypothetical protein GY711_28860 [bacterium]|nr:hypothetical protein [bacterium]
MILATLPLLGLLSLPMQSGQVLWISASNGGLYRIVDYASSAPTGQLVGILNPGMFDIAVNPVDGQLYGIRSGQLYEIDKTNAQTALVPIAGTVGENSLGAAPNGLLYSRSGHGLYVTDPVNQTSMLVGHTGRTATGDVAVDVDGFLIGSVNPNHLDRVDPATGQSTLIGSLGINNANGLEIDCDGTIYAFNHGMHTVDRTTGAATYHASLPITGITWGAAFEGAPPCTPGTSYCSPALPNSTGFPATLATDGSNLVADNDLTLIADALPPGEFGYFLVGSNQGSFMPPGSQGILCLTCGFTGCGGIGRFNGPGEIIQGPTGSLVVDLTSLPLSPPQAVQPGETWNFQCWFRDLGSNNFTDAVSITFE